MTTINTTKYEDSSASDVHFEGMNVPNDHEFARNLLAYATALDVAAARRQAIKQHPSTVTSEIANESDHILAQRLSEYSGMIATQSHVDIKATKQESSSPQQLPDFKTLTPDSAMSEDSIIRLTKARMIDGRLQTYITLMLATSRGYKDKKLQQLLSDRPDILREQDPDLIAAITAREIIGAERPTRAFTTLKLIQKHGEEVSSAHKDSFDNVQIYNPEVQERLRKLGMTLAIKTDSGKYGSTETRGATYVLRNILRGLNAGLINGLPEQLITISTGNLALATEAALRTLGIDSLADQLGIKHQVFMHGITEDSLMKAQQLMSRGADVDMSTTYPEAVAAANQLKEDKPNSLIFDSINNNDISVGMSTLALELYLDRVEQKNKDSDTIENLDTILIPYDPSMNKFVLVAKKLFGPQLKVFAVYRQGCSYKNDDFENLLDGTFELTDAQIDKGHETGVKILSSEMSYGQKLNPHGLDKDGSLALAAIFSQSPLAKNLIRKNVVAILMGSTITD